MNKSYHVVVSITGQEPKQYELQGGRIGIGRGIDNQIPIEHDGVSGSHCEFVQDGDAYELLDLGSTNGSRVNGIKVDVKQKLNDGDRILLAETVAIYFYQLAEGQATPSIEESSGPEAKKSASEIAHLGDKIAIMKTQEIELEKGLEIMRKEFEEMGEKIKSLEIQLAEKKAEAEKNGITDSDRREIQKLEEKLFSETRRWNLLADNLQNTQAQLQGLVPGAPAPSMPGAVMPRPAIAPPGSVRIASKRKIITRQAPSR